MLAPSTATTIDHLPYLERLLEEREKRAQDAAQQQQMNVDNEDDDDDEVPLPLEYVEFELKHSKEYMAKLKFNLLELTSKRVFLDKLMPTGSLGCDLLSQTNENTLTLNDQTTSLYDDWSNCQSRWSPAEIKELEGRVEGSKSELKAVKSEIIGLKEEIGDVSEHLIGLKEELKALEVEGGERIRLIRGLEGEIKRMEGRIGEVVSKSKWMVGQAGFGRCGSCEDAGELGNVLGIRSVEELTALFEENRVLIDKRSQTLKLHKNALIDLSRLNSHHQEDLNKLRAEESRLQSALTDQQSKRSNQDSGLVALEQLCAWYRGVVDMVTDLTGTRIEMIRPDYLLASVRLGSNVVLPVHLTVDPHTGKLLAAQVAAPATNTSATLTNSNPRFKKLCREAVDSNDICSLLRQLQQQQQ